MLVVEPERRLSISQILSHSWMGGDGVVELEPGGCVLCVHTHTCTRTHVNTYCFNYALCIEKKTKFIFSDVILT